MEKLVRFRSPKGHPSIKINCDKGAYQLVPYYAYDLVDEPIQSLGAYVELCGMWYISAKELSDRVREEGPGSLSHDPYNLQVFTKDGGFRFMDIGQMISIRTSSRRLTFGRDLVRDYITKEKRQKIWSVKARFYNPIWTTQTASIKLYISWCEDIQCSVFEELVR
ncbi:hypothetical protein RSAG8_06734, partial [Rhizoctonia solani AG-8 WAC10335]